MRRLTACRVTPVLAVLLLALLPIGSAVGSRGGEVEAAQELAPSWQRLELPGPVYRLYAPRSGPLFALTAAGLHRSDDGGAAWIEIPLPEQRGPIQYRGPRPHTGLPEIAVHPLDPSTLYAESVAGVAKSTDSGASWETILTSDEIQLVEVSPADPNRLYVSTGFRSTLPRLLESLDAGASWRPVGEVGSCSTWTVYLSYPHLTDPARWFRVASCTSGRTSSLPLTDGAGNGFRPADGIPRLMAGGLAERPGRYVLTVGDTGSMFSSNISRFAVYRSDDDAGTWKAVFERTSTTTDSLLQPDRFAHAGIALVPARPDDIFIGVTQIMRTDVKYGSDAGVAISRILHGRFGTSNDRMGWSWRAAPDLSQVYDIALRNDGGALYAATESGLWQLPDPTSSRTP